MLDETVVHCCGKCHLLTQLMIQLMQEPGLCHTVPVSCGNAKFCGHGSRSFPIGFEHAACAQTRASRHLILKSKGEDGYKGTGPMDGGSCDGAVKLFTNLP